MLRRDLLSIILRLGAGFIVLILFAFFLWSRIRKTTTETSPSPSPSTVVIAEPTPTLTPSSLPSVGPTTPSDDEKTKGGIDIDKSDSKAPSQAMLNRREKYITKTYTVTTYEYTTHSTVSSTGSSSSTSADAQTGSTWAHAETSSN
jgi:hypothetical protein